MERPAINVKDVKVRGIAQSAGQNRIRDGCAHLFLNRDLVETAIVMSFRQGKLTWLFNGVLVSVLLVATANAISFFFRSHGFSALTRPDSLPQAMGFPFEIWSYGRSYKNGAPIDSIAFAWNAMIALGVGIALGFLFIARLNKLNKFMHYLVEKETNEVSARGLQFSIAGILIFTFVVALVFAVVRSALGASPRLLLGIYSLGPAFLIIMAMIPKSLSWQTRVVLLTPSTLMLIAFTMYVGNRLSLPFEHVMLGIFVCWVPQTVITAALLMTGLAIQYARIDFDSD